MKFKKKLIKWQWFRKAVSFPNMKLIEKMFWQTTTFLDGIPSRVCFMVQRNINQWTTTTKLTWNKSVQGRDVKYLKCCTFISIYHPWSQTFLVHVQCSEQHQQGHYFLTNSPNNCFESTRTVSANLPSVLAIVKRDWLDCSAWL